jgi:AraC family transcriptional regulator
MAVQLALRSSEFRPDRGPFHDAASPVIDFLSLLEALDLRIAAGLTNLRRDVAGAREHLDEARELISASIRGEEVAALSAPRTSAAPAPQELQLGGLTPRKARQVREYVALRLAEQISIGDLAGLVGLSTSYFCRAFRTTFAASPHQYVEAQRMATAQRLMLETDMTLLEIALTAGFGGASHFSKVFLRREGLSPMRWRRLRRG